MAGPAVTSGNDLGRVETSRRQRCPPGLPAARTGAAGRANAVSWRAGRPVVCRIPHRAAPTDGLKPVP